MAPLCREAGQWPAARDWPFAQRKPLGNELGGPTILQIDLCSWSALDTRWGRQSFRRVRLLASSHQTPIR